MAQAVELTSPPSDAPLSSSPSLDSPPPSSAPSSTDTTQRRPTVDEEMFLDAVMIDRDGDGNVDSPSDVLGRMKQTFLDVVHTTTSNLKGVVDGGPCVDCVRLPAHRPLRCHIPRAPPPPSCGRPREPCISSHLPPLPPPSRLSRRPLSLLPFVRFQTIIIIFISIAALVAGAQTYQMCDTEYVYAPQTLTMCLTPWFVTVLEVTDWIILAVFILEAALKILAETPYNFRYFFELDTRCIETWLAEEEKKNVAWSAETPAGKRARVVACLRAITGKWFIPNYWNLFDFFIVLVSCYRPDPNASGGGAEIAIIFKLLRLLRLCKLFKAIPQLQMLVIGLVKAMNYGLYIGLLIGLVMYLYAVLGVMLWKSNDPVMYGTLHAGLITLIQAMSGDDWTELFYTNLYGCDHGLQDGHYGQTGPGPRCLDPAGNRAVLGAGPSLYFVTFHFVAGLLLVNLFIGAIMMALEESKEEMAGGEQLTVTIVRGRDLEVADWSMLGEAFSDPYCMLAIAPNWPPEEPKYPFLRPDKKADAYKYTTVKKQTLNPDYNETFVFNQIESLGSHVLFLQVYDWDRCGDDDPLGHAYIDIEKLK